MPSRPKKHRDMECEYHYSFEQNGDGLDIGLGLTLLSSQTICKGENYKMKSSVSVYI